MTKIRGASSLLYINQSTGKLTKDIVNSFVSQGHVVDLYTGKRKDLYDSLHKDVNVIESVGYNRISVIKRIASGILFTLNVLFYLQSNRPKKVVVVTNPFYNVLLTAFICKRRSIEYHIVIYDLYPDALKQTGSLKKESIVIRWITGFNKKLFRSAKSIITLSESMKTSILQYDVPEENIYFVHNWLINKDIKPREKQSNPFALKHNLADKKVVLYSGNMSLTHDLTSLVEAARILKDDKTVKFVFVGEGLKKKELVQKTQEYGLDNVLFLPYQRKDDFPFVISCADIGVVALGKGAEGVSVPSKTYSNLAAGLALLIIAPEGSELQRLIQSFDCGICCLPDNPQGVADQLRGLFNNEDRLKEFQRNSFEASKNFTVENAKEYVQIINRNDG